MSTERKQPTCQHCLEVGHTKASPTCPRKGQDPTPRPEKLADPRRWTDEQCALLKEIIVDSPNELNWEAIAQRIGHPTTACMSQYRNIVSPEEEIQISAKNLTLDTLKHIIEENKTVCSDCSCKFYTTPYKWQGTDKCEMCYDTKYQGQVNMIWERIDTYLKETHNTTCRFCKKDKSNITMHFDHLNMFIKSDSICSMVRRGDIFEDIIKEIHDCQIICKSCHSLVTCIENMSGFRRAKTNLTRAKNGTLKDTEPISQEAADDLERKYRKSYADCMEPVYALLEELLS